MNTNKCRSCGEVKPMQAFYKSQFSRVSGIGECAECTKTRVKATRMANIEYYRAYDRARANNPDRVQARESYAASEQGRATAAAAKRRYAYKSSDRRKAHVTAGNAIRDGRIERLDGCEHCGASGKLQAHHPDYSLPLCVTWLCVPCHASLHKEHREMMRGSKTANFR
jgi:hypothetical protein